jgi:hypothetical protein
MRPPSHAHVTRRDLPARASKTPGSPLILLVLRPEMPRGFAPNWCKHLAIAPCASGVLASNFSFSGRGNRTGGRTLVLVGQKPADELGRVVEIPKVASGKGCSGVFDALLPDVRPVVSL